ncbi:MAG: hypothetical protein V4563_14855 [Pseudomonadota bacterium]
MLNESEKKRWFDERMAKGYSFVFKRARVPGATFSDGKPEPIRNVAVRCVETNEWFEFKWGIATDAARLRTALEKLAKLGGGRSEGNSIAQHALNATPAPVAPGPLYGTSKSIETGFVQTPDSDKEAKLSPPNGIECPP